MKAQIKFYKVNIIDARGEELVLLDSIIDGDINEVGKKATEYLKENNLPKEYVWKTTPIVCKEVRDI